MADPCATPGDVNNALASWLSTSDGSHSDSAPTQAIPKLNTLQTTSDAISALLNDATAGLVAILNRLAGVDTAVGGIADAVGSGSGGGGSGFTGISENLDTLASQIADHDTHIMASLVTHAEVWTLQHQAIGDRIAMALGVDPWTTDDADPTILSNIVGVQTALADAITAAETGINAHTDEALVLLQGDIADAIAAVNAHTDDVQTAITDDAAANLATLQAALEGVQGAVTDAIAAHDAAMLEAIAGVATTVNDHTDGAVSGITDAITAAETSINGNVDDAQSALEAGMTTGFGAQLLATAAQTAEINAALVAQTVEINAEVAAVVGAATAEINGAIGTATTAIQGRISTVIADIAGLDIAVSGVRTVVNAISTAITSARTAIDGVRTVVDDILARVTALAAGPGTLTLVDTATWATSLRYAVAADQYQIDVDTAPASTGQLPLPDGVWYPKVGWCVPFDGSVYGARQYVEFSTQVVPVTGITASGLFIYCKAGATGSVRAYRYV